MDCALVTNASTPAAAVEEITVELAERALEIYAAEEEPWRAEAEPPPEVAERVGEHDQRICRTRGVFHRMPQSFERVLKAAFPLQGAAEVEVGVGVDRAKLDGAAETCLRILGLIQVGQRGA